MIAALVTTMVIAGSTLAGTGSMGWVCPTLDNDPSEDGVWDVVLGAVKRGYSSEQDAEAIASEVQNNCPEYIPLLLSWAEKNGG